MRCKKSSMILVTCSLLLIASCAPPEPQKPVCQLPTPPVGVMKFPAETCFLCQVRNWLGLPEPATSKPPSLSPVSGSSPTHGRDTIANPNN